MNWAGHISKAAIYVNTRRKTTAEVKSETGCDVIFNGGLFDMSAFTPCCHLKVDGNVLVSDRYRYLGYGWNDKDVRIVSSADLSAVQNYIACVCLTKGGKPEPLIYSADLGGARERTAWGIKPDGAHYVYVSKTPMTPEALQAYMIAQGCDSALMLDGGGSTQGIAPNDKVESSRIVHNFICLWDVNHVNKPTDNSAKVKFVIQKPTYKWAGSFTIRKTTDFIILHHAAANGTPEGVHSYHQQRGWIGIGYNYYIRKDGTIYEGRPENAVGAHTVGYNSKSIGICFEGNFEEEQMSEAQFQAGVEIVKDILKRYPKAQVKRHKDFDTTACPGKNFPYVRLITAITPVTDPVYRVIIVEQQVGAFKSKKAAEIMKAKIATQGYKAIIQEV